MFRRSALWAVGLTLLVSFLGADETQPAAKRAGVLDIIPADAVGAVSIRNVAELIERGDKLIDKAEIKVPFRLSDGYSFVLSYLGIKAGHDREGAAALMMIRLKDDKVDAFKGMVLAVPVADFEAIARDLHVRPEDLKEGKVIDRQAGGEKSPGEVRYVSVRGQHLLLGTSEKHVAAAAGSKTLRDVLPADDVASFATNDIVLFANVDRSKEMWGDGLGELQKGLTKLPPDEAAALRELLEASPDLKHVIAGIRLDDGLGLSVSLGFNGDKSRELLTRLQGGGKGTTSLAGLPSARMIAGHAARGQGERTATLARGLLLYAMLQSQLDTQQLVSAGHRANVVGVFGEVWQRLEGSRAALYENENSAENGQFSLVAILLTDDAPKFITDMTSLNRFINASGFSLDDAAESIDVKTIAELIAQLGDDDYAVRQTASTKLGLIGPTALPALIKAEQAGDPEVRYRAKQLCGQINTEMAGEKQDLLKRDLLTRLRPQLAFFPKAERRAERPIDIVQLRLREDEVGQADQLRRLFGPDWNKLRLATVGNQVVVLLGSQTALLEQAIKNVVAGEAKSPADRLPSRLSEANTAEFHLSLTRAQQLVAGNTEPLGDGAVPMTSFGVQITPQRVRASLFSQYEEVKIVMKQLGW